jgi:transcription antitermination factor NusG
MRDFKVGDRVRILPGVATPFVGMDGTICEIRPHDQGIKTMTRHFVVFSRQREAVLLPGGARSRFAVASRNAAFG